MAAIGMMDAAFFVGKNELLNWLNDLLQLNYTKVEQCANGAAYCQILDAIYPVREKLPAIESSGDVNMKKVIFDAKLEHDFIKNYKALQAAFDKKQIAKHIEVNKLVKAKPLDNLEFLQWIKRYFDLHYGGQEYNAVQRRGGVSGMLKENAAGNKPGVAGAAKSGAQRVGASRSLSSAASKRAAEADDKVAAALTEELTALKLTVAELEKERDFYFGKLRDVEITCQTNDKTEVAGLVDEIQKILYSTAEDVVEPAA